MADTVFVGSKEKSQTSRGQNQDQTGSFTREKSLAPIPKVAPPNASTPNANAADDSKRLGEIMGHPIAVHGGMRNRSTSTETIPAETIHRDSGKRLLGK